MSGQSLDNFFQARSNTLEQRIFHWCTVSTRLLLLNALGRLFAFYLQFFSEHSCRMEDLMLSREAENDRRALVEVRTLILLGFIAVSCLWYISYFILILAYIQYWVQDCESLGWEWRWKSWYIKATRDKWGLWISNGFCEARWTTIRRGGYRKCKDLRWLYAIPT